MDQLPIKIDKHIPFYIDMSNRLQYSNDIPKLSNQFITKS